MADHDHSRIAGEILGGGAIAAVSGFVGAVLQAFRKPSSTAELTKIAQEAAGALIKDLRDEVDREAKKNQVLRDEVDLVKIQCDEHRQHKERCEADLSELRGKLDDLMNGPVPAFGVPAPRD